MKKSDLKTGMVATVRSGKEYVIFKNCAMLDYSTLVLVNTEARSWQTMDETFDENLLCVNDVLGHDFDIVKIELPRHVYGLMDLNLCKKERILLWEREDDIQELTVSQIEKLLGYKIKVVADETN